MTEFKGIALSVLCLGIFVSSCADSEQAVFTASDWPAYGGQNNGNRYSTLTQVNRDNVSRLKPAWQFDMDDAGASQTQPIVVGGVVYGLNTDSRRYCSQRRVRRALVVIQWTRWSERIQGAFPWTLDVEGRR